ncbi:MAG: ATP-binding protein [Desulfuromonadaceae bacterium]|nr:ATP-binding protein [Desulfuromonadaceae bacterium]MDD2855099.1 ATP-binding protein [Desulfuromonadaceae bacterium]
MPSNTSRTADIGHRLAGSGILLILAGPLLCLLLAAGFWYWTFTDIDTKKQALEKQALADAAALCNDYEQYLNQAIDQANLITLQVHGSLEHYSHEHHGHAGHSDLKELSKGGLFRNPRLQNVLIIDRHGRPVASFPNDTGIISFADRDYFLYHQQDDSDDLLIGKPLLSRLTDRPAITFTRRLHTTQGAFDGIVLVTFDPHHLTAFYAGSFPGKTGLLMTLGLDGTLRSASFGQNAANPLSPPLRAVPLFNAPEGAVLLEGERWFSDRQSRYVAWKTMEQYPLIAVAGISAEDFLIPQQKIWANERRVAFVVSVFLSLFAFTSAVTARRLTKRRQQEEELRAAYRLATEGGSEGYFMYEPLLEAGGAIRDFVLVDCSERGAGFYGMTQQQILRMKLSEIYPATHYIDTMEIFCGAMVTGFFEDEILSDHDGSLQIEWAKRRIMRSGMGLAVTVQDVSERRQAEDALRASEAKLSALFTSMTEMVVLYELVFDEAGVPVNYRITDCNAAYTRAAGIRRKDAIGKLADEMSGTPEPPYLDEFTRVGITGEPCHYETYLAPMDRYFTISMVSPGRNCIATIATDVSETKRVQAVISAKNKELEQIVYVASHDLRSPLVNVDGFSRELDYSLKELTVILDSGTAKDELEHILRTEFTDMEKSISRIRASTRQMDNLLNGLLKLSRSGRAAIQITDIDMNECIGQLSSSFAFKLKEAAAELIADNLPDCRGDVVQVTQVFSNLIDNAIKYRNPERPLSIQIQGTTEIDRTVYRVEDNGIGIAENHFDHVFELFHRLEPGKSEGEGLGLTIARQSLGRMYGEIRLESKQGVGSVFIVSLPPAKKNSVQGEKYEQ